MRRNTKRNTIVALCVAAFTLLTACTAPVNADEAEWSLLTYTDGENLFGEKCGMCHRESGMGTGLLARRMDPQLALLENREDLNQAFVSTVVRNGLNNMFPLSRGEVSDDQLAVISAYLAKGDE